MNESLVPNAVEAEETSLGRRSASGGAVLLAAHLTQLASAVLATMVVARILSPADFGLFAMALIPLALAVPVRDFGLPFAIVHQTRLEAALLDRLFRVNLALSAALAALMGALAPLLAWFFEEPRMILPALWLAVATLLRGSANVHVGVLQRRMRYARLAMLDTLAVLAGAVAAVVLAWRGHGVTALLAQQMLTLCVQAVLLWAFAGWRPRIRRPREEGTGRVACVESAPLDALLRYGRALSASRLLAECAMQSDRLLVGRLHGSVALGLYQNALRWVSLPLLQLLEPLRIVVVSGFSRLQAEPVRYRRFAGIAFELALTLLLPLFVALALVADLLIAVLLGTQWEAAVPLFRVLAVAMLFEGVAAMAGWVFLGEGRTAEQLRFERLAMPFLVLCLALGALWGVLGVAIGHAAGRVLLALPTIRACLRGSPLHAAELPPLLVRPLLATLLGTVALLGVRGTLPATLVSEDQALALVLASLCFVLVYIPGWLLMPGGTARVREITARWRR